jgi:hypothetical protein
MTGLPTRKHPATVIGVFGMLMAGNQDWQSLVCDVTAD